MPILEIDVSGTQPNICTKRKPCPNCPWIGPKSVPYSGWTEQIKKSIDDSCAAPVQACHVLSPNQQVPLIENKHVCVGHLAIRMDEIQRSPCPDEELLQTLTLILTENI